MHGFTRRVRVADALQWLDEQLDQHTGCGRETVPLDQAAGRVLAAAIDSPVNVPHFDRAMMDGYAVRAADIAGASSYNPLRLIEAGVSLPGRPHSGNVAPGHAVRIMTGAPLPPGADAVLPVEFTERELAQEGPQAPRDARHVVTALAEVPPGKHVGRTGEDVKSGATVLPAGRRLRPQDVGILASLGPASVDVLRSPRVRIVVTGDELVPAGEPPRKHQIADANGPMLAALVRRDGGTPLHPGIVPDDRAAIRTALHADADIVLVSGGSSCGEEDHAPSLLAEDGNLAIHGIAMRPSSPAGMGTLEHRIVFLLPGNPVSCLCAYDFFAGRAIRALAGRPRDWPYIPRNLPLARKLVSQIGRLDYARVRIVDGKADPLAVSGASILSSTTRADGFVIIPPDSEGYPPSATVTAWLYDAIPTPIAPLTAKRFNNKA